LRVINQRTAIDETIFPAKAQRGVMVATVNLITVALVELLVV